MSAKKKFNPRIHDENPDWTAADFAKSRPASSLPPAILAQFKNKGGRPKLDHPKEAVKLRIDAEVLRRFRKTGAGWQTRMNDVLKRAAMRLGKPSTARSSAAKKRA